MKPSRWTLAALALMIVAGCGKKPPQAPPAPVAPAAERPASTDDEAARRRAAEAEEARRRAEEEARRTRAALEEMVFFDFDESTLRPDARAVLDAKVPILRQDETLKVRIEGNADDRGSTEYNLALGMRRAEAVKAYLAGFGIDGGRLSTVSYGEERPLVTGHDEVSWARNRRAEFVVSGGRSVVTDDGR